MVHRVSVCQCPHFVFEHLLVDPEMGIGIEIIIPGSHLFCGCRAFFYFLNIVFYHIISISLDVSLCFRARGRKMKCREWESMKNVVMKKNVYHSP